MNKETTDNRSSAMRRQMLGIVGTIGIMGIAGCSASPESNNQSTPTNTDSQSSTNETTGDPSDDEPSVEGPSRMSWPEWRGNPANTGSIQDVTLPSEFSMKWNKDFPAMQSSYVVTNSDTIFMRTNQVGSDNSTSSILAVETTDGSVRWRKEFSGQVGGIIATPDEIYGLRSAEQKKSTELIALSAADGTEVWKQTFEIEGAGQLSDLGDSITFGSDGTVYHASKDGEKIDTIETEEHIFSTISNRTLYAHDRSNAITAYNLDSGSELWSNNELSSIYGTGPNSTLDVAPVRDGMLYKTIATNENNEASPPASVVAVDAETGEIEWSWEIPTRPYPPITVDDEKLYMIGEYMDVFARNLSDGSEAWSNSDGNYPRPGMIRVIGNKLVATNYPEIDDDGYVAVVDTQSGELTQEMSFPDKQVYSVKPSGDSLIISHSDGIVAMGSVQIS